MFQHKYIYIYNLHKQSSGRKHQFTRGQTVQTKQLFVQFIRLTARRFQILLTSLQIDFYKMYCKMDAESAALHLQ